VQSQARSAMQDAAVIVFAVDARTGWRPGDAELARELPGSARARDRGGEQGPTT